MDSFYQAIAILTAGIALTLGLISLLAFFNKGREKAQLVFTFLCFFVVIFILLPPVGFIQADTLPYSTSIKVKRIFNFSFVAFFPWFVALYTGFKKKLLPAFVTVSVIACYWMMFFNAANSPKPWWLMVSLIIMAA